MAGEVALTLAHSPDPDDVFMWWPITGMIEPPSHAAAQSGEVARVVSGPEMETGRFRFVPVAADIAALNRRAMGVGDLDVTAVSMNCYAHVRGRYQLSCFGSSMGYGYGPRVVGRAERVRVASPVGDAGEVGEGELCKSGEGHLSLTQEALSELIRADSLIAVPGKQTTAFLLLSMMLGEERARLRCVEMPFDQILDAVRTGEGGVTHGLLIHQSQLTFGEMGLRLIADVGAWWMQKTGLPLPLGGNAVRRDLDERFGAGTTREVVRLLDSSIRYALAHRERSLAYCMKFAPEITRAQAERYIEMYVNDLTVDAGEAGAGAVQRLLDEGHRLGLCPDPGKVEMLRPAGG